MRKHAGEAPRCSSGNGYLHRSLQYHALVWQALGQNVVKNARQMDETGANNRTWDKKRKATIPLCLCNTLTHDMTEAPPTGEMHASTLSGAASALSGAAAAHVRNDIDNPARGQFALCRMVHAVLGTFEVGQASRPNRLIGILGTLDDNRAVFY